MIHYLSLLFLLASYGFAHASEAQSTPKAEPYRIVTFGNSLTEGYQLPREEAYPAQLEALLRAEGHHVEVINHGISGDTTAGGRARIAHSLKTNPDLVIVELGPNDFLRGIMPSSSLSNLDYIITAIKEAGSEVVLVAFNAAPNIGPAFKTQFDAMFPALQRAHSIMLYNDFLLGVAGKPSLNLSDGIHPNKEGYAIVAGNMLPLVKRIMLMNE